MSLAGQWKSLGSELPERWVEVQVRLDLDDSSTATRAAALLGPAQPYRPKPDALRFAAARNGSAVGPEAVTRLLTRLDDARIGGRLRMLGVEVASERAEPELTTLAASWDAALAGLPSDWSDLFAELELLSSDYIEPAAVLCIQMNPRRVGTESTMRFRAARTAGYGVSPGMARRCFERCDEAGIKGSVTILRALSDSHLAATQGPVWHLDGKTV